MTDNRRTPGVTARRLDPATAKHRAALARAYRQVVHHIPFSSVAQVYECLGAGAPEPRLGRSCVGQSLELGRLLDERDLGEVGYPRTRRHVAVRCSRDERAYLLDPYLMHVEPLDLDALQARPRMEVAAYPLLSGGDGARLALRLYRSGTLALALYTYDRDVARRRLRSHFELALTPAERRLPAAEEMTALLFGPEQTTLSLRVVTAATGLLELVYPLAAHHGCGVIEESQLLIGANYGPPVSYRERERFEALLRTLCRELGSSRAELIEHVLGGVELYERHAPAQIAYADAPVRPLAR
jgi:hypothetical protein